MESKFFRFFKASRAGRVPVSSLRYLSQTTKEALVLLSRQIAIGTVVYVHRRPYTYKRLAKTKCRLCCQQTLRESSHSLFELEPLESLPESILQYLENKEKEKEKDKDKDKDKENSLEEELSWKDIEIIIKEIMSPSQSFSLIQHVYRKTEKLIKQKKSLQEIEIGDNACMITSMGFVLVQVVKIFKQNWRVKASHLDMTVNTTDIFHGREFEIEKTFQEEYPKISFFVNTSGGTQTEKKEEKEEKETKNDGNRILSSRLKEEEKEEKEEKETENDENRILSSRLKKKRKQSECPKLIPWKEQPSMVKKAKNSSISSSPPSSSLSSLSPSPSPDSSSSSFSSPSSSPSSLSFSSPSSSPSSLSFSSSLSSSSSVSFFPSSTTLLRLPNLPMNYRILCK